MQPDSHCHMDHMQTSALLDCHWGSLHSKVQGSHDDECPEQFACHMCSHSCILPWHLVKCSCLQWYYARTFKLHIYVVKSWTGRSMSIFCSSSMSQLGFHAMYAVYQIQCLADSKDDMTTGTSSLMKWWCHWLCAVVPCGCTPCIMTQLGNTLVSACAILRCLSAMPCCRISTNDSRYAASVIRQQHYPSLLELNPHHLCFWHDMSPTLQPTLQPVVESWGARVEQQNTSCIYRSL